jgi:hypothetical protein
VNTIPWYQSSILRQQIVQLIVAALTIFGVSSGDFDINGTVGLVFGGITGVTAVWTFITRLYKVHRPITQVAAEKHMALNSQRGFARPLALLMLSLCACSSLALLPACAGSGTRAAYSEAKTVSEQAYVLAEQYAALVEQAANLKEKPTTPTSAIARMQKADQAAKPVVLKLKTVRDAYVAAKSAQTEAELQVAINNAVLVVADLVRAVQSARGGA